MILQSDPRFPENIRKYACYWMSLLWFGNKLKGYMFDVGEIERLAKRHTQRGWILDEPGKRMWVMQPDKILEDVSVRMPGYLAEVSMLWNAPSNAKAIVEILKWQRPREGGGVWNHFVAGDGEKNVTYDPEGTAKTVAEGKLVKRYVKFEAKEN